VLQEAYMPWTAQEQVLADVVDERASWERWVPQMHAEFAGDSNRPRASPSPPYSYWWLVKSSSSSVRWFVYWA